MKQDNYPLLAEALRQFGRDTQFVGEVAGKRSTFVVAEHANIGQGWFMRNIASGEVIGCNAIDDIAARPSIWKRVASLLKSN